MFRSIDKLLEKFTGAESRFYNEPSFNYVNVNYSLCMSNTVKIMLKYKPKLLVVLIAENKDNFVNQI